MNLHGFSDDEAEEILSRERQRREITQEQIDWEIYTGERDATDADGVQTMRDFQ